MFSIKGAVKSLKLSAFVHIQKKKEKEKEKENTKHIRNKRMKKCKNHIHTPW